MNKIINKFLLNNDKLIPVLHLKQPGFTYSACEPFTKHCARIQNFRERGNLKHLYRHKLDKTCFIHDAAYSNSTDLAKRAFPDKVLRDRPYEIAQNCNYDGYKIALASMVYKFFDKKTASGAITTSKAGMSVNEQLAEELHKPVIKSSKEEKYIGDLQTMFGKQL